jgi:hypothetical protein
LQRLLFAAFVALTLSPPSAPADEATQSIPQDPARLEKRYAERLDWNRSTLRGAYDKVGKRNPRWDKAARDALEATARMFAQQVDPVLTNDDVNVLTKAAMDLGCDDPVMLYVHARTATKGMSDEEYQRRLKSPAAALAASAYPPVRRAMAQIKCAQIFAYQKDLPADDRGKAAEMTDAALAFLTRSVAKDARTVDWADAWYKIIQGAIETHRHLGKDPLAASDHVDAILRKVPEAKALRLQSRGEFLIHYAWEARGSGFSNTVTEENFRKFAERLTEARALLNEAWAAKPGERRTADLMLSVERGIGGGDRDAMELWFSRAIKADGNDYEACWAKLEWLDPKWYGTKEEMLAFGRACRETKNWRAGITLLCPDAHFREASRSGEAEDPRYLLRPDVWADIQLTYQEFLKHYPNSNSERSNYAAFCYYCSQWEEARKQFEILGDKLTATTRFSKATLEGMRDEILAKIKSNAEKARGKSSGEPAPMP